MMDILIIRRLNFWYFIVFGIYCVILLIYLAKTKQRQALKMFIIFGITLTLMELFGGLSGGVRTFIVDGIVNPAYTPVFSIMMGFFEGGGGATLTYLMAEAWVEKRAQKFAITLLSLWGMILCVVAINFIS